MTGAASIAAVALAVVFGWAALAKVIGHAQVRAAFADLRLPAPGVLAVVVPVAEVLTAVALVVRPSVGGALALVLLLVFTGVIVRAMVRGVGCGCFGAARFEPARPADVVRNGLLAALALIATAAGHLAAPHAGADLVMLTVLAGGVAAHQVARRVL